MKELVGNSSHLTTSCTQDQTFQTPQVFCSCLHGRLILLITCMITDRLVLHSVLLPLFINELRGSLE